MITFLTNRKDHHVRNIETNNDIERLANYLNRLKIIAIDIEAPGLRPYQTIPLLIAIGDHLNQWVIDATSIDISFLNKSSNKLFVGHNIKYDFMVLRVNGFSFRNIYDTMLVERELGLGSGRANDLEAVYKRRLGKLMPEEKSIRDEFIGMTERSRFSNRHILYSAGDIGGLLQIKSVQAKYIKKYGMELLFDNIHFPFTTISGMAELEGMTLDEEAWIKVMEENKVTALEYAEECDKIIQGIARGDPPPGTTKDDLIKMIGGRYARKRRQETLIQSRMFGLDEVPVTNTNKGNVNYNAPKQILNIFKILKQPLPWIWDIEDGKRIKKDSSKEEALERYLLDYPESILVPFIKTFLLYKEYETAVSKFGLRFLHTEIKSKTGKRKIGYKDKTTGKVHTSYRQGRTANDRLASGDDNEGFYNSQSIKKENRYRHCFGLSKEEIDQGYWITTVDLSGAELVILASLSGDQKLIDLQSEDIHSYLATASFTNIIKYIVDNVGEDRARDELYELLKVNKIYNSLEGLTSTEEHILTLERVNKAYKEKRWVVDSKYSKDIRTPFKNVVYGGSYGAGPPKIGETLNIAVKYAEIVYDTLKEELPVAFKFLDDASKFGVKHGYIEFNSRTHSRHWFKAVLDSWKYGHKLNRSQIGEIERACKNYRISGTQANMILEGAVEVDKWVIKHRPETKCILLKQVHDELVYKHLFKNLNEDISRVITTTANKYLTGIEMQAEYSTYHHWHK